MPTKDDILNEAQSLLGIGENPPGSNLTPIGAWFGVNGVAWCAETVCFTFFHVPFGPALIHNVHSYYSGDYLAAGRAAGEEVSLAQAGPGDIVIFDWGDGGITDHIGIVEVKLGPHTVGTIEGNTSDMVARKTRNPSSGCVMWFIRPKYSATPTPPPEPPKPKLLEDDMGTVAKDLDKQGPWFRYGIVDVFNALPDVNTSRVWLTLANINPDPVDVYFWVDRDDKVISLVNGPDALTAGATGKVTLKGYGHAAIDLIPYIGSGGYKGGAWVDIKASAAILAGATPENLNK